MSVNRWKFTDKKVLKAIRFLNNEISVAPRFVNQIGKDHFSIQSGKLFYDSKEVIPDSQKNDIIMEMDSNIETQGGRDKMTYYINQKYVGISKQDVADYLSRSVVHQLNAPVPRRVNNRPIVIKNKSLVGQVDLVDMSNYAAANNNAHWIMVYIDLFSKFTQATSMQNKEQASVLAAYDKIMESMPIDWRPRTIQCDNGSEFLVQFQDHLKNKYNQKVIHSQAYNPSSQGCVERVNKTIKTAIFKAMTRYNSKRWIDLLPLILTNINNAPQSTLLPKLFHSRL